MYECIILNKVCFLIFIVWKLFLRTSIKQTTVGWSHEGFDGEPQKVPGTFFPGVLKNEECVIHLGRKKWK